MHNLFFDGCSKSNPGKSGIGTVLYSMENEEIFAIYKYIGICTNNESEYSALILGLESCLDIGVKELSVFGDSLLVINQVNGKYKVKSPNLVKYHDKVLELASQFKYISFTHVLRQYNKRADELSNMGIELEKGLETV